MKVAWLAVTWAVLIVVGVARADGDLLLAAAAVAFVLRFAWPASHGKEDR